jgi:hypothetical protein
VFLELVDDAPTKLILRHELTNFHACPQGRISAGFATATTGVS